jgi:2'-5' RNA ligase
MDTRAEWPGAPHGADEAMGRLFLAVTLPAAVRHGIEQWLAALPGRLPGRLVPPESWHLTLRFLGEIDRRTYEALAGALAAEPLGAPSDARFAALGAFPTPERASVLWLGVGVGTDQLAALAARCEAAARHAGLAPERRAFAPHLTLSRLRPSASVESIVSNAPACGVELPVREVTLMRSEPTAGAPRYTPLERWPLR